MLLCYIYFCALALSTTNGSEPSTADMSISELNVLLPYTISRSRVKYELKATGGCFKWTSSNTELIHVESIFSADSTSARGSSKCSLSAYVSVASGPASRASTFVNAEDISKYTTPRHYSSSIWCAYHLVV